MLRVLKQLSWFFKEHKKRYILAISILIFAGFIVLIPPQLTGYAIDQFQQGALTGTRATLLAVSLLILSLTIYGLDFAWAHRMFGGSLLLGRTLRSRLMRHLFRLDIPFFEQQKTGDLLARGTNDMKAISMTAGFGIFTLVDSTVWMLTLLIAMAWLIDWKLTLAAVLPLPIVAISVAYLGKLIHVRFTKAQGAFGDLNNRVLESVSGMRVIRAFRGERRDETQFKADSTDVYNYYLQVARIESFFAPVVSFAVGLSYVISLGYGAYLVFHQQLTLGQIVTFNLYLGMLIWPMFALGELINVMQQGGASYNRVRETLAAKKAVHTPENALSLGGHAPIVFDNVSFSYPETKEYQLKHLSFTIHQGETIGIVGKTGSGKSTLIKQLLKFYPYGEGTMTIAGTPLSDVHQQDIRALIGYVPQDHVLFSQTVRENILFAAKEANESDLQRAIETSSFKQDLAFLPKGLDTKVGENGVSLSGGQKQRISIARALINDPDILILDDSLSAVDAKTEAAITRSIQQERAGKTTIITTHRISAITHADHIIVLDNGQMIAHGTHEALMAENGWYAEQARHQAVE
ncbi:ABC transporter ATP-binding protein [Shouchella lonarensis]|uniref:ATP-binding cassette, subfamily B n=1 Tax=Shouchella lonarensis TaxID=1464122 RepID=A0A1G6MQ53_9BACI|nr:ABC transporter ATP-binding protein [Shouchella lonarensis]SDC57659.1 ATP-binding cassette, subfamily B [Shouchella lonarensis]